MLGGMEIRVHPDTVDRRLSWRERLFSWPWRPRKATAPQPNPLFKHGRVYPVGGALHMSESTYEQLKAKTEGADTCPDSA